MAARRTRARGFGLAGLLVIAGVMLLLANFGLLPSGFGRALWPFWPLFLIALGVNLAVSRIHVQVGSSLALGVVGVALGLAWWQAVSGAAPASGGVPEPIQVAVADARAAQIGLTVAAGELELRAGPAGPNLIEGAFTSDVDDPALDLSVTDRADGRHVRMRSDRGGIGLPRLGGRLGERWELRLNPAVPTELRIDGGAADLDIDARALNLKLLDVDTGAVSARIIMPRAAGETRATFDIGAAALTIEIPEGVAARARVSGGLTSVDVDDARFPRSAAGEYRSPNFATATNRVVIDIDAGASSVRIR